MSESHYAPYHIKLTSSSTKERTSEINSQTKESFQRPASYQVAFSRKAILSLRLPWLWLFITGAFCLILQYCPYFIYTGTRIRSSQFTHVWVFISLWDAGWILHLIIFNYRSLQSSEKNVGQTSSTIFLFLAERCWQVGNLFEVCVFYSLFSICAPKFSSFQFNPWAPLGQEDTLERDCSAHLSDPIQNNLGNTLWTQGLGDLLGLLTG